MKNNKKVLIFDNTEEISKFAIKLWTEIAERSIKNKKRFIVAISGGKTPITLYNIMSNSNNLPWAKTHIFFVDERFVSFENIESNYNMIKRNLLDKINIPKESIHPIHIEKTPHLSAARYENDLKEIFNLKKMNYPNLI